MKKSKSYALVVHEFGYTRGHGGIASYALERAKFLNSFGHKVTLICFESSTDHSQIKLLSDVHFIPTGLSHSKISEWISIKLDQINPDVIETSDYQGWLADYLVKSKIGLINNRAFVDIRHHTATKEIFEWNHFMDISTATQALLNTHRQEVIQQRLAMRNTFPSEFLRDYILKGESIPNVAVESYPFELPKKVPKKDTDKQDAKLQIVSLGRFEKRKGYIHLFNTLNNFEKEFTLTLAGNSSYESNGEAYRRILSNMMSDRLLSNTHFIDFLEKHQFQTLFENADVFVLPSPFENFPYAAIEAILSGTPVVVSKHSGFANVLTDRRFIFDPFKPGSLNKALENIIRIKRSQKLSEAAQNQFKDFTAYVRKKRFRSISFNPTKTMSSTVKHWVLGEKLPTLENSDTLCLSGFEQRQTLPETLQCDPETRNMIIAFTAEGESATGIQTILKRELPFLIPLLTKEEIESLKKGFHLGVLEILDKRVTVVSMVHQISHQATGFRVDHLDSSALEFLKSKIGYE